MQFHPAANLFPMMSDEELDGLIDDVREYGLKEPIRTYEGMILDGRNRYQACIQAKVEAKMVPADLNGKSASEYVISLNLHRRHLNASQKAMVAAAAKEFFEKEAKERQKRKPANSVVENLPQQNGKARDKAAAAVGVSGRSVDHASKVIAKGTPELKAAVTSGKMAVSAAAKVADLPAEKQREAIREVPSPPAKKKTPAQKFSRLLDELSSLLITALNDYGTVASMFDSSDWSDSSPAETADFIQMTFKKLAQINKEAQDYVRSKKRSA